MADLPPTAFHVEAFRELLFIAVYFIIMYHGGHVSAWQIGKSARNFVVGSACKVVKTGFYFAQTIGFSLSDGIILATTTGYTQAGNTVRDATDSDWLGLLTTKALEIGSLFALPVAFFY